MRRRNLYITLGILIALVPLLGFPNFIRTSVLVLMGLVIALLAFFSGRGGTKKVETPVMKEEKEEHVEEEE